MGNPPVLFFGCWNRAGHYMHRPGGQAPGDRGPEYYGDRIHLDGTLAPRLDSQHQYCGWAGQGATRTERDRFEHRTGEFPQGQFLLHHLDSGYTAIQWWDRCQGDTRGACNSTVLLLGQRTAEEMIAALWTNFPHVVENLARGGPEQKQPPVLYLDHIDSATGLTLARFATVR